MVFADGEFGASTTMASKWVRLPEVDGDLADPDDYNFRPKKASDAELQAMALAWEERKTGVMSKSSSDLQNMCKKPPPSLVVRPSPQHYPALRALPCQFLQ